MQQKLFFLLPSFILFLLPTSPENLSAGEFTPPVELLSFSVYTLPNNTVELQWTTLSETDNDFFSIERSKDEKRWEQVVFVKGAGTSKERLTYKEVDQRPFFEASYYRLKQIDYNGDFSYSRSMEIYVDPGSAMPLEAYPNPSKGFLTLEGSPHELSTFSIYDLNNRDVSDQVKVLDRTDFRISLTLAELPRGIYLLKTASRTLKVKRE